MAFQTTELDRGFGYFFHNAVSSVRGFFSALGRALVVSHAYSGRLDQVHALQAKSDEELAEMGIKRDEIVHHVFGDLFYL